MAIIPFPPTVSALDHTPFEYAYMYPWASLTAAQKVTVGHEMESNASSPICSICWPLDQEPDEYVKASPPPTATQSVDVGQETENNGSRLNCWPFDHEPSE